jgi:hypothetical protein
MFGAIENVSNVKELWWRVSKEPIFLNGRCHLMMMMMIHTNFESLALTTNAFGQCLTCNSML